MFGKPFEAILKVLLLFFLLDFGMEAYAIQMNSGDIIIPLEKVGEIQEGFSSHNDNFFIKITGMCTDFDSNLYVIDSGWNKIFKFDSKGNFVKSFGRPGQGPGEFLGNPRSFHLSLSYGNDGNLYVVDPCNGRLSKFLTDGTFLKQFPLDYFLYDSPTVNSRGDIFLLSKSGLKLIECLDYSFKLKKYLYDFETHFRFPYGKPFEFGRIINNPSEHRYSNKNEIIKLLDRNDNLTVVSNYSFMVTIFNDQNKKINEFIIKNKECILDFKKRLKKLYERHKQFWVKYKSNKGLKTIVLPFGAFFDHAENICIIYENMEGISKVYRYTMSGDLLKVAWYFPDKVSIRQAISDGKNRIFSTDSQYKKIKIYKINRR